MSMQSPAIDAMRSRIPDAHLSPGGIAEVDAHRYGRTLFVSVRRIVRGRESVFTQEFECGPLEDSVRALRAWLHTMALSSAVDSDARVRAWAEAEARRVLDASG